MRVRYTALLPSQVLRISAGSSQHTTRASGSSTISMFALLGERRRGTERRAARAHRPAGTHVQASLHHRPVDVLDHGEDPQHRHQWIDEPVEGGVDDIAHGARSLGP